MNETEQYIRNFKNVLEHKAQDYTKTHGDLVAFWNDSFVQYIGKMKIPKKLTERPGRYFHLFALIHCIKETSPVIVWNLSVGNIKTSIPVLDFFIKQSINNPSPTFWINIDIVPAIKQRNELFIKSYYHIISSQVPETDILIVQNTKIFNLIGSLEDFFESFPIELTNAGKNHVFLCLDGISNVSIEPKAWISWWRQVRGMLDSTFAAWYITWLQSSSLLEKFDFYYRVVYHKHRIPLHWVEISQLNFNKESSGEVVCNITEVIFHEFETFNARNFLPENEKILANYVLRFFSSFENT